MDTKLVLGIAVVIILIVFVYFYWFHETPADKAAKRARKADERALERQAAEVAAAKANLEESEAATKKYLDSDREVYVFRICNYDDPEQCLTVGEDLKTLMFAPKEPLMVDDELNTDAINSQTFAYYVDQKALTDMLMRGGISKDGSYITINNYVEDEDNVSSEERKAAEEEFNNDLGEFTFRGNGTIQNEVGGLFMSEDGLIVSKDKATKFKITNVSKKLGVSKDGSVSS